MSAHSATAKAEPEHEVTPLELFFDLVFVFAVSQLSHHLLHDLSWRGAAETLVMLVAVFTVWSYTSWAATMIPAERSGTRTMVLGVMLLGLFMNAAVTKAFAMSSWSFVVPLLVIQLGRTVWTIVNAPAAVYREHYIRVLVWFIAIAPLWITGAAASSERRLLWWTLAAALELIGTWLAHPVPGRCLQSENVEFDSGHMLERCRLFLLIALGETVLTTGTAIAEAPQTLLTLTTGAVALAGAVALWSLTFGRSLSLMLERVEKTSDPIRESRYAVNALIGMVAGLIAIAVASEKAIAHPHEHGTITLSLLLAGGPILFLAGQGWYLRAGTKTVSRLHFAGGIALALMGLVGILTPAYVALILIAATLTVIATLDRHQMRRSAHTGVPNAWS